MSWQMLDGPSRRLRVSWAIPEHLRDTSRYGPFRRPLVPTPLDPDVLLQYMDNAISITENAQATKHLSLLFASSTSTSASASASSMLSLLSPSSSSSSSSSFLSHTNRQHDDGPSATPPLPSAQKISRFKSTPSQEQDYINSLLKQNDHEETTPVSRPLPAVSKTTDAWPLEGQGSKGQASTKIDVSSLLEKTLFKELSELEDVSKGEDRSGREEEYDAQAADGAYRAACCALSEGNAELALSLLHVASAKCPPNKHSALGKVHRLMAASMQLMEKHSAVLSPLPVDKDA